MTLIVIIKMWNFLFLEFDSYYKYALENKVHHQSKRSNAEDDIVAKKVASTKKPTILTKPETQKSFLKGNKSLSKDHTTSNISLTFFDGELNETLPSNNTVFIILQFEKPEKSLWKSS